MITLYRAYNADDALLYVGISSRLAAREAQHRSTSPWCAPDTRFVHGETFTERKDALAAERAAIRAEHPEHNLVGADQSAAIDAYAEAIVAAAPRFTDQQLQRIGAVLDTATPAAERSEVPA